jgi:DNA-binding MarR family transcriptional regulator
MPGKEVKRRPNQYEKTDRAFRAYLDLLDAAEYMRAQVYDQLSFYGLTMNGFRVLELLEREGPIRSTAMAERCQWNRQNLDVIVRRLAEDGWVRSELVSASGDGTREGRRVAVLRLTPSGAAFIKRFLPRHGKVIKAHMRALEGREQLTLSQLCRKLKEGDVVKFISEMEHEDV